MVSQATDIRQVLATTDDDFRKWDAEHHEHEARLAELAAKDSLTEEEEIEEKRLKKRKLFLKDMMAEKIRHHEHAV